MSKNNTKGVFSTSILCTRCGDWYGAVNKQPNKVFEASGLILKTFGPPCMLANPDVPKRLEPGLLHGCPHFPLIQESKKLFLARLSFQHGGGEENSYVKSRKGKRYAGRFFPETPMPEWGENCHAEAVLLFLFANVAIVVWKKKFNRTLEYCMKQVVH